MTLVRFVIVVALALSSLLFPVGCGHYGKLVPLKESPGEMTLQQLKTDWSDYHVYYNEDYGARALIFDPKGDDKRVTHNTWTKIEDQRILEKRIKRIEDSHSRSGLYRLLGPDGSFFAYVFSNKAESVVGMKAGENELLVMGLIVNRPPPR
ncbi:hypothetical protein ACFL9T_14275 [Thermodesulfobacteriota bacterium]